MDLDKARQFLENNHRAVIATFRADVRSAMSPVAAAVDSQGRAVVSSRETAYKVRHLRHDPRVALCVLNDGWYGEWIQVEGRATIVSLPDALEPLIDYYRRVAGEHPDWDDYREAMAREKRVLIRIDIERAGPDRSG